MDKNLARWLLASALALVPVAGFANFHTFTIQEIYSNASGSVQYVVLQESQSSNGENLFKTHAMSTTAPLQAPVTFPFPVNLPSILTSDKFVLIGTQSFAALGLIAPDYVVPDGFVPPAGVVNFAGVDSIAYATLPTDGINALYRDGSHKPNLATNFAGATASVGGAPPAPPANYQGLWFNPAESGWGINFAHQGDTIFASWFTYDLSGKATWLVMTATKTAPNTYSGQLFQGTGPAFDAVPFPPLGSPGGAVVGGLGGTATVSFTDLNNGTLAYTLAGIPQNKSITRELIGPQPTCVFGARANLALATNYTDLWWASPPGSEAGWGINLTHQGDIIFATWFTYDQDHTPMWLVVQATKTAPGVYSGAQVFRLAAGPAFNAIPFPPIGAVGGATGTVVGTATFRFSDGNAATFSYTINGITQSKQITREVFTAPGTVCQYMSAAEGVWVGTTSRNESVHAIILDDGTYYMLFSYPGSGTDAGVFQGSSIAAGGQFAGSDGSEFPIATGFETGGFGAPASVSGDYTPQNNLQLTIVDPSGARSLAASYVVGSDNPPSIADAAGSYAGFSGHAGGKLSVTFTVDSSGNIAAKNSACSFQGTMTPLSTIQAFSWTAQSNGNCIFGAGPVFGVMYYDPVTRQIRGFAPFADHSDQFYLLGTKTA